MQRSCRSIFSALDKLFVGKQTFPKKRPALISIRWLLSMVTVFCLLIGGAAFADEWSVGLRTVNLADPVMQDDINVAVWYPTQTEAKEEAVAMVTLQVAKDADLAADSKGLILISHGFSGNFLGHHDTARYLATSGYIVATFTHSDLAGLQTGVPELDPLISRPRQIALIVDALVNQPLFKSSLLKKPIGFVGFSLGAYTGLIAAGAKPDLFRLEEYCGTGPRDFLLCSVPSLERFTSIGPQLASLPETQISAAVLLAPAYGPLFSAKSFANVSIPIRLISAGKDEELDNQFNAQHLKKLLSERATHKVIADAGHFIFMAPCSDQLQLAVPTLCDDPASVDRVAIHKRLNREIAVFFDEMLY